MRIFDFTLEGETIKLAVPPEEVMETHIEEGMEWVKKNETEPIPARQWTERRRRFVALCMNLADSKTDHSGDPLHNGAVTGELLGQRFDSGFLNAASAALYEKCGIKTTTVGEVKAAN